MPKGCILDRCTTGLYIKEKERIFKGFVNVYKLGFILFNMGWREWPRLIKGGIIGGVLYPFLFIIVLLIKQHFNFSGSSFLLAIGIGFAYLDLSVNLLGYYTFFLWIIFGAIIGGILDVLNNLLNKK